MLRSMLRLVATRGHRLLFDRISGAAASWLILSAVWSAPAFATQLLFMQEMPSGFGVRINGGPELPSGPITIRGIVDDTTTDISSDSEFGEFPLIEVTFSGAGYVDEKVITPLSLLTWETGDWQHFAFQRLGDFNHGTAGWNGMPLSGPFMTDINDLSSIISVPYTTSASSPFWSAWGLAAWTLESGDTIGANEAYSALFANFSIRAVPEPGAAVLAAIALIGVISFRRITSVGSRR